MTPSGQTVCLCMIVKDEAPVIARCLASVRPLIDHWIIVDTGSSDGTQDKIREAMAGLPGELVERPWVDFGYNRSEALTLARPHADYSLIVDADDFFETPAGFAAPTLEADSYVVDIEDSSIVYQRTQLVKNALAWRYTGVLHEFLNCAEASSVGHFPVVMRRNHDGARRRNPETYKRDAALLERALETETDPFLIARYTFYLGQSYRDAGQRRPAIDSYLRRAALGFWDQEIYESLLNAGKLMADEGDPTDAVLAVLERATATVPERAEASHAAARICRDRAENQRGMEAAKPGLGLPQPASGLFLEPSVYDIGLLDEFAVNAYWAERHIDSLVACAIILSRPNLDEGTRNRIRGNRDFAYDRLKERSSLWIETLADDRVPRIAVVTPYYKEPPETLRRCIDSVKSQSIKTDHILVADGHPQDWLDGEVTRHVRLDWPSADYGNTPRTMGGLLAASARYTAICLLDADCWFDTDHVERCLAAALAVGIDRCGAVTTSRTLRRPDLSPMPLGDEDPNDFVDTNCYLLLPPSFGLLASWSMMPKTLDWVGDRVFFLLAKSGGYLSGRTRSRTVNYLTTYAVAYRALGETPPANAKELPDHAGYQAWIDALPTEGVETLRRQLGADIRGLYRHEFRTPIEASTAGALEDGLRSEPGALAVAEARKLFAKGKIDQAETRLKAGGFSEETKDQYAAALCDVLRLRPNLETPKLVWRCEEASLFEIDWIEEVLAGVTHEEDRHGGDPEGNHLIVCDNRLTAAKRSFYVDRAARGCRIHLIHLSDEWTDDDVAIYEVCVSVFRNYWSPTYDRLKHVVTFPLGYKRGFRVEPEIRAAADRPLVWSFAGHGRSETRQAMLTALAPTGPNQTHISSGFDAADGLSQDDYRRQLETSLFSPCPTGFSTPDTFRLYESLEAGCIPIVEHGAECDYFGSWLGRHPIPTVLDWNQAPELISRLLDTGEAEPLRRTCMAWWDAKKRNYQDIFSHRIGSPRA